MTDQHRQQTTRSCLASAPHHRLCPLCQADNRARDPLSYSRGEWLLKQCATCGFVYLENAPPYEDLSDKYAWEKTTIVEEQRRLSNEPITRRVSTWLKRLKEKHSRSDKLMALVARHFSPGNVLDVGCGSGRAAAALDDRFTPYGVEISKQLAAEAGARIAGRGGHVIADNAVDGVSRFQPGMFTGVIMRAFLEHEMQPGKLLAATFAVMMSGGAAIIKVPNYASRLRSIRGRKWCGFRFPDHVNYFTPASLTAMVEGAGFTVAQFGFLDRLPTSDNMWMVIRKP
jgi:protein-L-isoaspartate O-methyltransferase